MIKRALALLLLLGAGFLLLQVAIGDAAFGSFEASRRGDQRKPAESRPAAESLGSRQQAGTRRSAAEPGNERSLRPSISGPIDVKRQREVPLPSGGWIMLTVYQVISERTKQVAEDRYQLEAVTMRFFEQAGTKAEPAERLTGELHASTVYVTLGRDEKSGAPSLREDKEMELFDAVVTTNESARAKNLRLVLGHAFVLTEAAGTRVRSAEDDAPFELRRPGENDLTLTGRGAHAWLPSARDADANRDQKSPRLMELRANSEPVVLVVGQHGKTTLSAKGPLSYEEDLDSGAAHVLLEQQVRFKDQPKDPGDDATATGDRLEGWLVRPVQKQKGDAAQPDSGKVDSGGGVVWRRIELRGEKCTVLAKGAEVTSQRIDVLQSADGKPWFIAATKGKPTLVQKEGDHTITVEARDGIRLVRFRPMLGAAFASLGLPKSALGSGCSELAWFDGPTHMSEGELTLDADGGACLLRGVANSSPTVLVGRGSVDLRHKMDGGELVVLGDRGLQVTKSGDDVLLSLDSPEKQIVAKLPPNSLDSVRMLRVRMHGKQIVSLVADGDACRIRMETKTGIVRGTAAQVLATDPDSITLRGSPGGAPAHLERTETETLDAPEITIGNITRKISILSARGGARLHFDQSDLARERNKDTQAEPGDLAAQRILLLPYLVPKEVRGLYGAPLGAASSRLFAAALGSRWLVADGAVRLDRKGMHAATATGEHLVMRLDPGSAEGELEGGPARILSIDEHGQENVGEARVIRIRVRQAGKDQILRLMSVGDSHARLVVGNKTMPGPAEKQQGRLEVVCNGEIVITNAKITFEGGGRARSLLANGDPDPAGLALSSRELSIDRDEKTGQVKRLLGRGDVVIVSKQLLAKSDEATLDPITKWCTLSDLRTSDSVVSITMNRAKFEGSRIELNWQTGAFKSWRGTGERVER